MPAKAQSLSAVEALRDYPPPSPPFQGGGSSRMTQLTDLGIAAIRDGVRDGAFSAREVAEAHIAAVEKGRPLNAFTVETPDHALAAARAADAARNNGGLKPLSGVPLGIKDLFAT